MSGTSNHGCVEWTEQAPIPFDQWKALLSKLTREETTKQFLSSMEHFEIFFSIVCIDFLRIRILIIEQDRGKRPLRLLLQKNTIDKHYQEIKSLLIQRLIHFSFHQRI